VRTRFDWSFDRLIAALVLLTILLAAGLSPMHTDSWWQLRSGQDMWQMRGVIFTDIHSHTAHGAFWPNHEWLAELVYYVMWRMGGLPLVTLFSAFLITGGWALSWRLAQGPVRVRCLWIALSLVSSASWWQPRPHAFSLLFIPATVTLVATRRLWYLPLIFLVWANVHGGVLLGFVLLGAGFGAELLLDRRAWRTPLLVVIACVVATTATPMGLAYWLEIPRSLARIRLYPFDEWQRPTLTLHLLPFWTLAVLFCYGLVSTWRARRRLTSGEAVVCACALVLLPLSVMAIRNVGPFLMLAAPALTVLLPLRRQPASAAHTRPLVNAGIAVIATIAVAIALAWAYAKPIPGLRWEPIPAGALRALPQCPGHLFNLYDQGGYLLWFAPGREVFLDGRQDPYPSALILEQIRMQNEGLDFHDVFSRYDIRCAYLPSHSPTVAQLTAAGWATLYRDEGWVVLRN